MLKIIGIVVLVMLAVAVFKDPTIIKPWADASIKASKAIGEGAREAGNAASKTLDQVSK